MQQEQGFNEYVDQGAGEATTTASQLDERLRVAEEQARTYLTNWQRAQADLENYKKRAQQARREASDVANSLLMSKLLSALDDVSYTLLTPSQTGGIDANTACLLVLDDTALATMAQRKAQGLLPGDLPLVGFGRGEEAVPLMEQGLLQGLVADDPYALGYMAGALLDSLRTGELKPSLHLVPQRLVTPDTLYDPENVKLMFPLLD